MSKRQNIAIWSGPRNLSTALMRSFGNRRDVTAVYDEPFYASYLITTNKKHPMFDEVIKSQENDYNQVVKACTKSAGNGICYQKHMVHHLHPNHSKKWILSCTNCFLIRKPEEVISSFLDKWPEATFEDFGFKEQFGLYNYLLDKGGEAPVVVDASDLRNNSETTLKKLCFALNIDWDPLMLCWTTGLKDYDGVWAKHWYPSVMLSSSFRPESGKMKVYSQNIIDFADIARDYYKELFKNKI